LIKVLLADDHTLFREGLKSLLASELDLQVVGEASNGQEAILAVERLLPDVVVMDVGMPVLNGIQATQKIKQKHPQLKVLILTQYDSPDYLFTLLEAGASGYVLKRSAATELIWAIKSAYEGAVYLSPAMAKFLVKSYLEGDDASSKTKELLTEREQEVLKLIAEGYTNQEIAEKLVISLKTVQTHRAHIMEKLHFHDRVDLVKYAISKGIISLPSPPQN
jgi:DNA-binding NarL/FixJ family response regulator